MINVYNNLVMVTEVIEVITLFSLQKLRILARNALSMLVEPETADNKFLKGSFSLLQILRLSRCLMLLMVFFTVSGGNPVVISHIKVHSQFCNGRKQTCVICSGVETAVQANLQYEARFSDQKKILLSGLNCSTNIEMSKSVNSKLDEVLKGIGEISQRMDKLDQRLDNLQTRLNDIEQTLSERTVKVKKQLTKKIGATAMAKIEKRLAIIEKKEDRQAEAVMKEPYEKCLNILIHGLEENHRSARESRSQTLESMHQFMREGLNIENPSRFVFVDYHRFPQRPL